MKNSILILAGAMALTACGSKSHNSAIPVIPKNQTVYYAPTGKTETGVIVSGISKSALEKLVAQNKQLRVRIVNPLRGLYEFFGQDLRTVTAEVDTKSVLVEQNSYVDSPRKKVLDSNWSNLKNLATASSGGQLNDNPLVYLYKKLQGVTVTGPQLDFVNSCHFDESRAPKVTVLTSQPQNLQKTMTFFDLGQSVNLDGDQSQSLDGSALSYQWLVTVPEDSDLGPTFGSSSQMNFTPDTTGMHIYSLVVKDSNGFCNAKFRYMYVSAKDPFKVGPYFPASLLAKVDPNGKMFWPVFQVGSVAGWPQSTGRGVTIAVIDSGVNYNHPALQPNIWQNIGEIPDNQIDDDNNGFIDDYVGYNFSQNDAYPFDDYGHGSHVAGIAASQLFGAAREAHIMPVKATFIGNGFDIATVAGAVEYAVDNGANVINMSVGWQDDYPVMRQAFEYAQKHDVLIVVAAGNDSSNNDAVADYPANYNFDNVIAVAASDRKNNLAFYSNFGAHNVPIAAPGGTQNKMVWSAYKKNPRNLLFVGMAGTSMASPLVAGVAAQVWGVNPGMTAQQVKQILLSTTKYSAALAGKVTSGGVVDAQAAIAAAEKTLGSPLL